MPKQSGYVNVPRTYKTPGSHKVELAYITKKEAKKLKELDLHNSGIGKKMHYGPKGIPNYNGGGGGFGGGFGDDKDAGGREGDYSGSESIARLGETLDWGMGPEGSAGTISSSRAGEDRDFGDDVSLQQKTAFMATAPVPNVTNYLEDVVPPREAFKTSIYSGPPSVTPIQAIDPSAGVPGGPETQPFSTYDGPSSPVSSASTMQLGLNLQDVTPPRESFKTKTVTDMTQILSKLTSKQGLTPDIIRALTMDQVRPGSRLNLANVTINDQLVKDLGKKLGIDVGAYYNPSTDKMVFRSNFTTGDVVHELGHRDLQSALRAGRTWNRQNVGGQLRERSLPTSVLDQIRMPNVQALYETGGNPFSPGYGAQGEMVTSRSGTARNLYDAMSKFSGGGEDWVDTVLNSPSEFRTSRSLPHAAIKAGWSGNTALDPNSQVMAMTVRNTPPFQDPAWEDDPNFQEPYAYLPGVNVADPTYSVPGSGNVAAGYQAFLDKQQELPGKFEGGAYTSGDWVTMYGEMGPEDLQTFNKIMNQKVGLTNHPLKAQHGLIQEFVMRNKNLFGGPISDTRQASLNSILATKASPSSKINQIEKLGLASEFWDKLNDFYSTDWNPYYSPEQGQTMIDNYLSGAPKLENQQMDQ